MKSPKYQNRYYRDWQGTGELVSFKVQVSESDLLIMAEKDLSAEAREALVKYRHQLESYIKVHPEFLATLKPYFVEPLVPPLIRDMALAGQKANVGPMAAVAGAIAEKVGAELLKYSREVIIENGGDIFIAGTKKRSVGIYGGKKIKDLAVEIGPEKMPCGVCTSSGVMGHSLSFGKADSATVISGSASLADAAATAVCNMVQSAEDIEKALEYALGIEGVTGAVICKDKTVGIKGDVKLIG